MKHLKILGLVAVAVVALLAFLGAGSASATVLCKTAVNPCPEGERYGTGSLLVATSTHVTFYEANKCTESTLSGKTTSNGGSGIPVPLAIEKLSFSTCTVNTLVTTLGEMKIEWITGTNNGTIKDRLTKGTVSVPPSPCGWQIGFNGEWVTIGTIKGGKPATIEMEAPLFGTCPFTFILGSYTVPAPEPLYVESS
jgi:hypothetical protein